MTKRPSIAHFSPFPPLRNGIADYAAEVATNLARSYESFAFTEDPFAIVPEGVQLRDLAQAYRFINDQICCLYQIGNNWDHTAILRTALAYPGITVLHDLKLLYLHEALDQTDQEFFHRLCRSNRFLAPVRATDFVVRKQKLAMDYLFFDLTAEIVERSKAVVVHSQFAKAMLKRHLGRSASNVHVIPHFAFAPPKISRREARHRLALPSDYFVVVTCGFATKAKRYDWLIEALDQIAMARRNIIWVQAGPLRKDEYDLEGLIAQYPRVREITRLTGFISAEDLDAYLVAADAVVNLRYPSVGESSGILSRALSAGACTIVSDTAGYREYPADAVIRAPTGAKAAQHLAAILRGLMDDIDIARSYGRNARSFAEDALSIDKYAGALDRIIQQYSGRQLQPSRGLKSTGKAVLEISCDEASSGALNFDRPPGSEIHLRIGPIRDSATNFDLVGQLVPSYIAVLSAKFVAAPSRHKKGEGAQDTFLEVDGYVLA